MQEWLQADNVRLIGITGTGGYGKSSLVAKIFATAQSFEKQVWATFSQNYPFAVWGRWLLEKLGKATPEKEADLLTAVCNNLRTGRYLLVLDNLETLLEANGEWHDKTYYDFLLRWLSSHTETVILVTSREQPQLPPNTLNYCRWLPLKGLSTDAGVALLEDLDIQGADAEIREFVKRADGHPLLIKLVAGVLHADEGDVVDISALRQNIFEILGLHRYDSEASIGKILDASIARLTPKLQQLLFNLSVYRPAFNATAAAALLPEQEVTQADLRGLAKRSLLQENKLESGWVFEFQPLILAYLKQQAGDLTEVHERAIAYYQSIATESWHTIEDITPQLEIFYHLCELKQYRQANNILYFCHNFLDLRGYYTTIIELSSRLEKEWQPSNQDENSEFAYVLTSLGNAYQFLGQYQIAIDYHHQSLAIFLEIGDRKGEAISLNNLGNAYNFLGQYQIAIDYHHQSLAIKLEIGDRTREGGSLCNLGNAYRSLGQYQQAIDYYQQALIVLGETGQREFRANSLAGLGNAYNSLGQYQIAIDYSQQSLAIFIEISARRSETASLNDFGKAYNSLGQYQKAIDYHQQSLAISLEIGDRKGEATSLNNLGNAYRSLGQYQQAIDYYQQALIVLRETNHHDFRANSLTGLGSTYYSLGQYQQAIDYYQQSLAISLEIGDRKGEAASLNNLGCAYQSLGQYQKAINFYQQSLAIKREIGDRNGEAASLTNLGCAYQSLGQYQKAIDYHQQSLAIEREIGDRKGEAISLGNLGNTYICLREYQQVIDCYQQLLTIQREMGDRNGEAKSLQNLAQLYHLTGRIKEGYAAGIQATQIQQELELPIEAWAIPKWQKSIAKFALRGKLQLGLCFLAGLFAFPFALVFIVSVMLWRVGKSQLLRR
ncbi:transcriptional regulator [Brasilonema octagenarum UFV-E1]|uniref:Transcriptional regulator n=2 Tax=Bromeliae group (in: Brasilonema) TaxID=3398495 RepID=A0A856MI37_9CYAN|nr:tetratricopeptide repeat protein [Brasilonema sennae]QDL09904.1 transcriptional regulator [Brasilonema sennae CENA114]QDL16256.1 transcriptional regulator [Brasilonema octagenarum UFV-E1]